ncbi:hypothetical protein GTA08_BOTSDO11742 [Neofusicoccum parvum]|uniref:Uncharacterized protein n=1 Tax=Neofusicoccum parvum TaxID=310453 RepID=A0ACB5SHP9_9PEZI|nr:hypothetical protein GTA08_BOTSDO11742 [Neofusicoccum parvum]
MAIQRHPRFDESDPRNSHYTLHCLWDFVHRTRYQLSQIDFQKLDDDDGDATDAFEAIISRTCMAHAMLTDPTGIMVARVMGSNTSLIDLGDEIRQAGALLMPDPETGEFTENPAEQRKISRLDLSAFLANADNDQSESEGEWEEGADDSEWEDVGPEMPPDDRCLFLELPREIRDQIYKYLLCADYTKRRPTGIIYYKPSRFELHLQTAILRTNKQVYREAREVLGKENRFVVVERNTDRLKQSIDDKQDGGDRDIPDPPIWVGRAKSQVSVAGEVMRINFSPPQGPEEGRKTDYFVFLVEELRDFFINLGKFRTGGVFRTKDLTCTVTLSPPKDSETNGTTKRRESALLDPLTKLRQLSKVTINGASDDKSQYIAQQMQRREFSAKDVLQTISELLVTVEAYSRLENYYTAVSYCDWCMGILSFFDASNARQLDENMVGEIPDSIFDSELEQMQMCAAMFRISLARALASIHAFCLEDAFESSDSALRLATMITSMPEYSDYPGSTAADGVSVAPRGAVVEWLTQQTAARIADAGSKGLVAAVDVARAYWYRGLTFGSLHGQEGETDRAAALSLALFVGREDVAAELRTLKLDLGDYHARGPNSARWDDFERSRSERPPELCDLPSYDRLWERPLPPPVWSRNRFADVVGLGNLLSRVHVKA